MSESEVIEQQLRAMAAIAFEGKAFTPEAVGNLCIGAADYLARERPLPVVEVFQCWWCNRKRTRATPDALEAPHRLKFIEELCDRPGCDPIKGTYPEADSGPGTR